MIVHRDIKSACDAAAVKPRAIEVRLFGIASAGALAVAIPWIAVETSHQRGVVRDLAATFLDCPAKAVDIGFATGTDTYDDYHVRGCGRHGLITCSGDADCAFHAPTAGGYSPLGYKTRPGTRSGPPTGGYSPR